MATAATVTSSAPPQSPMTAATASAVATAAAAASSKHRPPNLPTPKSGTYPSSINSPLIPTPNHMKKEECLKTPVTPPFAYLDFLNKLSPNLKSPLSTSQSTTFSFTAGARSPFPAAPMSARPILTSTTSTSSMDSNGSTGSNSSASAKTTQSAPAAANTGRIVKRPAAVDPPRPSSVACHGPKTAPLRPEGSIRRPSLMIPPSPSTNSPSLMSPSSARLRSPMSAGAAAKAYYTSGGSPGGWEQALSAGVGNSHPVCVKEVVTRTMTYSRPRSTSANGGGGSQTANNSATSDASFKTEDEDTLTQVKEEAQGLDEADVDQYRAAAQKWGHQPLVGEAPRGKRRKVET